MNSQVLQNIIINPANGESSHKLTKEYEAIKYEKGTIYDYSYWAVVEKYLYTVLASSVSIKNPEIYYNVTDNNYYFKGDVYFTSDNVSLVKKGYYYNDKGDQYINEGWYTYNDTSLRFVLYLNDVIAIDFGTTKDLFNKSFNINLGATKPTTAVFKLKYIGDIVTTKPDLNGKNFSINFNDQILSHSVDIPDFIVIPKTMELDDTIIDKKIFEKTHLNRVASETIYDGTRTFYEYKDWTWAYKIDFTNTSYSDLIVNYNELDENYYLSGKLTTSYLRKAEQSCWWNKNNSTARSGYNLAWTDYNDTECKLGLYINNALVYDMGSITESKTISDQAFNYNIGKVVPSDFIITIKFTGVVKANNLDAENNPFTLSDGDSVVMLSRITMPFIKTTEVILIKPTTNNVTPPKSTTVSPQVTEEYIEKKIAVFDGWRYLIGLRDVEIKNRKFLSKSEIITKKLETTKPVKKIVLYSNEIIPEQFLAIENGVEMRNDWIQYYISINDTDWFRISPMHHNQVGSETIPPKIYEINSRDTNDERISTINKGYITSVNNVYSVRLKIVLSRPETENTLTPIIEEYALKLIVEGGAI